MAVNDQIPPIARGHIRRRRIKVRKKYKRKRKRDYGKMLVVSSGYNFLENYGIVRKYMQWKYKITLEEMEIIYYLYPRTYFTRKDYLQFPRSWGNERFNKMIEKGLFKNVFPENKRYIVYTLTHQIKIMVEQTHLLLAGDMKIPTDYRANPCFKRFATYSQKRFRPIMRAMREQVELREQEEDNS